MICVCVCVRPICAYMRIDIIRSWAMTNYILYDYIVLQNWLTLARTCQAKHLGLEWSSLQFLGTSGQAQMLYAYLHMRVRKDYTLRVRIYIYMHVYLYAKPNIDVHTYLYIWISNIWLHMMCVAHRDVWLCFSWLYTFVVDTSMNIHIYIYIYIYTYIHTYIH